MSREWEDKQQTGRKYLLKTCNIIQCLKEMSYQKCKSKPQWTITSHLLESRRQTTTGAGEDVVRTCAHFC